MATFASPHMGSLLTNGSSTRRARLKAPSKLLLLGEFRWVYEFGLGIATLPALMQAERGDGHPVLVLPGFLAGDVSTEFLRRYLKMIGYDSYGWELGRNLGGVNSKRRQLRALLQRIHTKTGRNVSLIGWSLGGVYARDMALAMPDLVRQVVTLGSPFANDINATNASELYRFISGESIESTPHDEMERLSGRLPVPTTSIYTRTDGIVNWKTCLNADYDNAENIEVYASHIGLGSNPSALWAVADRLALKEGTFTKFDYMGPFAFTYPKRMVVPL